MSMCEDSDAETREIKRRQSEIPVDVYCLRGRVPVGTIDIAKRKHVH